MLVAGALMWCTLVDPVDCQVADREHTQRALQEKIHIHEGVRKKPVDSAMDLLLRARVPGGIEYQYSCKAESRYGSLDSNAPTLSEALHRLVAPIPGAVWSVDGAVINIRLQPTAPSLLEVIIPSLKYSSSEALSQILGRLLSNHAVQKRLQELRITALPPFIGLSAYRKSQSPKQAPAAQVTLTGLTLRQVLNRIAEDRGYAIWLYESFECDPATVRMSFIAQ